MNFFKAIYCNQYHELKSKGKEDIAQKQGTIISTIVLVIYLLAIIFLLTTFFPDIERDYSRILRKTFGRSSGRSIGVLLGFLLFGISYPAIKLIYGTDKAYQKTIDQFNQYSYNEQKNISKKGLQFFYSSLVLLGFAIISILIKTYIL